MTWQTKKLGELFSFKNGRAFKKEEWSTIGLPIIRIQNLNNPDAPFNYFNGEYKNDILVESGDLLFSWSGTVGTSFGSHLWDREPGVLNQHIYKITFKLDVSKIYAFYALRYITAEIEKSVSGAVGLTHITKEKLIGFTISVPPVPEQKRIVAILDKAFESIATAKANTEKNLKNARNLFESYLNQVFMQRGDGWVEKKLEEIANSDCSLSYGIVQPGEEYDEGMPIVRPTDLMTKVIRLTGLKRIDPKLASGYKRTVLLGGELLLCVRGSTGVVSIASPELAGANVTRGIVPIRFNQTLLKPEFGFYLINAGPVQSQIREKTYGTALMQINIRDLRVISLWIPPLKKQETIVAKLNSLYNQTQHLESLYKQKISALDELKKSILHKAFSGEL